MAYIYIQKARRSKTIGCDIIRLLPFMFARKKMKSKLHLGTSNQNILNPNFYTEVRPNIFIPDDRIHMHVNFEMGIKIDLPTETQRLADYHNAILNKWISNKPKM